MNAFARATASLFADPNLSEAARYLPAGGGAAVTCSVIRRHLDPLLDTGAHPVRQGGAVYLVPLSQVPAPTKGARLQFGASVTGPPLWADAREIVDVQPDDAGAGHWVSIR